MAFYSTILSNPHIQVRAVETPRCRISHRNSLQRSEKGLIVGVTGTKFKAHNINFLWFLNVTL